jgi:hypothetical protein
MIQASRTDPGVADPPGCAALIGARSCAATSGAWRALRRSAAGAAPSPRRAARGRSALYGGRIERCREGAVEASVPVGTCTAHAWRRMHGRRCRPRTSQPPPLPRIACLRFCSGPPLASVAAAFHLRHCAASARRPPARAPRPSTRPTPSSSHLCCSGVFWDKKTRRWRCQLGYQSKKIFLGYFDTAQDAAKAYDRKLVELRGASGAPWIVCPDARAGWPRAWRLAAGWGEEGGRCPGGVRLALGKGRLQLAVCGCGAAPAETAPNHRPCSTPRAARRSVL